MEQERRSSYFIRAGEIAAILARRLDYDMSQQPGRLALNDVAESPFSNTSSEDAAQAQVIDNRKNGTSILTALIERHGDPRESN